MNNIILGTFGENIKIVFPTIENLLLNEYIQEKDVVDFRLLAEYFIHNRKAEMFEKILTSPYQEINLLFKDKWNSLCGNKENIIDKLSDLLGAAIGLEYTGMLNRSGA